MAFFTKVDYGRQLKQFSANTVLFSGSTNMAQYLTVGSAVTIGQSISGAGEFYSYIDINSSWQAADGCITCSACSTGNTFVIGGYSATSANCNVTITTFSGVTGMTPVLSIGKVPSPPLSGGTTAPGLSASTLQINKLGLLPVAAVPLDLGLDNDGNVVRGPSSSKRYKTNLKTVPQNRYHKLLTLSAYFFNYRETGIPGFGMIAEDLDELGYRELVIYDNQGRPDNIDYKLLSVALLNLLQSIYKDSKVIYEESPIKEPDAITKVVSENYTTNGEYLIVVTKSSKITLNSITDTKIKIKSLSKIEIIPDKGLIDSKWESISLDGDSCIELVFIKELSYWVIVSSDGLKDI
jgi:hypothetical protein